MEKRFENQVAIVTGGADGIGKAVVERLAREGAQVTIFDLNEKLGEQVCAEFGEQGLTVSTKAVNVADEESVKSGIDAVISGNGGRLDVMVHCAAVVGQTSTKITDVDTAEFDKVCAVNLTGSFLITKYAINAMEPNNYGRVLLFASIAGKEGNAGMIAYSASKAGVIGLIKAVGKDYAESGITVNAIAPAVIKTPMVEGIDPDQVKYMTDKIPMKRCGTLDEVAALSCWIVSEEAGFNTAFTFDLTGGRAVY